MDFKEALEILNATVDANPDRAYFNGLADFVRISRLTVAAAEAVAEGRRDARAVLPFLESQCFRTLGVTTLGASPVWHAANNSIMDAPVTVARAGRTAWISLVKAANAA